MEANVHGTQLYCISPLVLIMPTEETITNKSRDVSPKIVQEQGQVLGWLLM